MGDEIQIEFGKRLRTLRTRAGLSQEKLGALAGVARNFVSMIENGQRNVTLDTVQKLAKGLGCRMAALMPDAEERDSSD
ncbi:MAG: transcriptional regulator [Planctomycetaceae bacterium]|nr:transcriptional regulator [Planctomycetaceae bacterium]